MMLVVVIMITAGMMTRDEDVKLVENSDKKWEHDNLGGDDTITGNNLITI